MITRRAFVSSIGAFALAPKRHEEKIDDLCILGATSGGVIAALEVARSGGTVTLLECGHHLGGMSASGLGWTDFTHPWAIGGLAREFYAKVGAAYNRPAQLALEPHVAEGVFQEMVDHPRIRVRFGETLRSVQKRGSRLQSVTTHAGNRYGARMFLDATYEGDLMAMAGVTCTVGREANSEFSETLNGVQSGSHNPKTGQFLRSPDPWRVAGNPDSGPLPYLLQDEELGEPGSADTRVQAYGYRLCLSDRSSRIPIEPTTDYDPARYELLDRWIQMRATAGESLMLADFMKYDPLPNGKWDFNNRWAISLDFLGASDGYPLGNREQRRKIELAHESYLRGYLHFLASDERVPASVRRQMSGFGLCADEFRTSGGWPHQIYVREARRMRSGVVMTEHHVLGRERAVDSVGLASYGIDMHAVRRIVVDGKPMNEGSSGHAVP